jgi:hypothetical protein
MVFQEIFYPCHLKGKTGISWNFCVHSSLAVAKSLLGVSAIFFKTLSSFSIGCEKVETRDL